MALADTSDAAWLPPELRSLARSLAELDERDRELVIAAVRGRLSRGLRTVPWEELRKGRAIAPAGGGDAVADCNALYDECWSRNRR